MTTDPFNIKWKQGDTIRRIDTGKPMLVIDVVYRLATIVTDQENAASLLNPLVILFRDYDSWAVDKDMDLVKKNDSFAWYYRPITL